MPHSDKTYMDSLALNNYECLRLLQYLNGRIEGHTAATRADDRFLCNLFEECVTQEGLRPLYYSADSNAALLPTAQTVPANIIKNIQRWNQTVFLRNKTDIFVSEF